MNRRLRSILVIALTWGALWAVVEALLVLLPTTLAYVRPRGIDEALRVSFALSRRFALLGALGGVVFAVALSRAGRGAESVDTLARWRVIGCGALGGLTLLLWALQSFVAGYTPFPSVLTWFRAAFIGAALGAGTAIVALVAARRGVRGLLADRRAREPSQAAT
jgi:hypothetical protein